MTDVAYPKMGFSVAWNDPKRGVLELESYVATTSARGDATRFTVRNLPDASRVAVLRDGRPHGAWRTTAAGSIEIETAVGDHRFEIATGYRGLATARDGDGEAAAPAESGGVATRSSVRRRASMTEIATAAASISAACPCCAGNA